MRVSKHAATILRDAPAFANASARAPQDEAERESWVPVLRRTATRCAAPGTRGIRSFPRKRESRFWRKCWVPACAGTRGVAHPRSSATPGLHPASQPLH